MLQKKNAFFAPHMHRATVDIMLAETEKIYSDGGRIGHRLCWAHMGEVGHK